MTYDFVRTLHDQPRIIEGLSITKAGHIGLSKYFLTTHGIQRGMRAYMYWDSTNAAIALAFTRKDDATAYPVRFTQRYGAFIAASRFFRSNDLDPRAHTRRYPYAKVQGEAIGLADASSGAFVLELSQPVSRELTA